MNIAIDARMVQLAPMHGIARYVFHLLRCLAEIKCSHSFFVLVNPGSPLPDYPWGDKFAFISCSSRWISIKEQWELPLIFKKHRIDLFHSPSFVAPVGTTVPQLLTVHDLNHLALPQFYSPLHRLYYETAVKSVLHRSTAILTVSQFSKKEICRWLACSPDKVTVTYNGVSEAFRPVTDAALRQSVRKLYHLPERFILCLGSSRPHKNTEALVKAYCQSNLTLPLVVTLTSTPAMQAILRATGKTSLVKFPSYIDDAHLPTIYSMAELFVFPSLYEGFGLPALEAMACGCPVLLSRETSLPEIVGELGYYLNPWDSSDISKALEQTVGMLASESTELKHKRLLHAHSFTWENLAQETLATYERLHQ
jgi:glycosyltransferase involved in cell wall biosynthesis